MSRGNAAANTTAASAAHRRPLLFIKAVFDGGTIRVHNGVGNIKWGLDDQSPAETAVWIGAGAILQASSIVDADERGPTRVTFKFSALTDEVKDAAADEALFERLISVYLGFLDAAGNLTADPDLRWQGYMDTATFELGGPVDAITVTAESELVRDFTPTGSRFTDEDQQERYSGDTGFEFLDQMEDALVQWGPDGQTLTPGVAGSTGRPDPNSRYYNQ